MEDFYNNTNSKVDSLSEELEAFVDNLSEKLVETAILDGYQSIYRPEEDRKITQVDEEQQVNYAASSLDVRIFAFVCWLFSARNMAKISTIVLVSLLINSLWISVVEMYSRPAILKPRTPKPFFAISSADYVTDYYTGNMRPERLLSKSDLVIIMYYAPWSIHSQHLRHQFEVVARVLSSHKNIRFVAINCWSLNGECRKTYKLYNYPVIVAYSGSVTSVYQGEYSTDHLYRWVVNVRNPIRLIRNSDEYQNAINQFHYVVAGYFPFHRMLTPLGYRSFAAAGMILNTGQSVDETTTLAVITNLSLAKKLGFRFEGDIIMYTSTGSTTYWPSTTSRSAQKIVNWVNEQRTSPGQIRWISFSSNTELKTTQFAQYLNNSAILLMVTQSQPIYSEQEDIQIFREIANEYWSCNDDFIRKPQKRSVFDKEKITDDDIACQMVTEDVYEVDRCCRSLLWSVDWNMGCSSSTRYKWESDVTIEANHQRRSHWTEEVLPITESCSQLENFTDANVLLLRCCSLYSKMIQPTLTATQRILVSDELRIRELRLVDKCMRKKLFEYMKYSTIEDSSIHDELEPSENTTVYGRGCNQNDSLSFVVLDLRHYSHFLDKWGIKKIEVPGIIAIDLARELFSVMEGMMTQKRLRSFIHEYHAHTICDHMLSEEDTDSKFITSGIVEDGLMDKKNREKQEHVLTRLTQKTFNEVVENRNSTQDIVVFFSGGNWHAPSVVAMHVLHSTAKYFVGLESLIKFYVMDTSRNEVPYKFNFARVPAIMFFLARRRDISWKFPETLPISRPNLLSFFLSRCSLELKWRTAISNCGKMCFALNKRRLRRRGEVLLREIFRLRKHKLATRKDVAQLLNYKTGQLRVSRYLQRSLAVLLNQSNVLDPHFINNILQSPTFKDYFKSLELLVS